MQALLALAILSIDQLTKAYFTKYLNCGQSFPLIKNFLHFTLVFNTGAAFGVLKQKTFLFVLVSISVIVFLAFGLGRKNNPERWALILIISGAAGNLIDRVRFGYVIDFIDLRIWPVFNIADSAITIGVSWIVWRMLFRNRGRKVID